MSIRLKTEADIVKLRQGGIKLARILNKLIEKVEPGLPTKQLDIWARQWAEAEGGRPAFLGYKPTGASRPYPAAVCISLNEEIVHGLPTETVITSDDVVTLDMGLVYENLYTDHAITVCMPDCDNKTKQLVQDTKGALKRGINSAVAGATIGSIGQSIADFVLPKGYGLIRDLAGHGVGFEVHEGPLVPNYGRAGTGPVLKPGLVLALEPMISLGTDQIKLADDDFTFLTADGSISAHFEHTIAITEDGPLILTAPE
ncbi:MAG: type I methionyl aminopeptidase [Patescibacteria group bacterium]